MTKGPQPQNQFQSIKAEIIPYTVLKKNQNQRIVQIQRKVKL